jgi:signal transduction histidine kinase
MSAAVDGDRLSIMVKDQGIGIAKKHHRDIFTAFFRADNEETRSASGTGLGLFFTKTLVEMHGGQIDVDSDIGRGTTMSFYIGEVLASPSAGARPTPPVTARSRLEPIDAAPST